MYYIGHIQNSGIFSTLFFLVCVGIFNYIQHHWGIFTHIETLLRHIQAYSDIFSTLYNHLYLQPRHTLNPSIFRTGDLFKTLRNVDQAYSSHIQVYSEHCVTLAYAETWHTQNPGIFRTLPQLHLEVYSEPCHINENLRIFKTLTYLKPRTLSDLVFCKNS